MVVDNATSDTAMVKSGVPQKTVLGPTLFLIYINDIANDITSNIRLFADDCVLCRNISNPTDNTALQEDFNNYINSITKKASSTLGFLERNLKYCPPKVKERSYFSLVRPKLEYASPIWNPSKQTQVKQIEQVQRNAAQSE